MEEPFSVDLNAAAAVQTDSSEKLEEGVALEYLLLMLIRHGSSNNLISVCSVSIQFLSHVNLDRVGTAVTQGIQSSIQLSANERFPEVDECAAEGDLLHLALLNHANVAYDGEPRLENGLFFPSRPASSSRSFQERLRIICEKTGRPVKRVTV
ncbi:unnamed protein product [Soboliphyme baturini]|uniref:Uncharacterized protein n=1 Tax=Soboliphyme baturini TaxID=241478 RepID=A0A183IRP4_9BILA|nr:unnamed protein product [Soboliphyme baturini]